MFWAWCRWQESTRGAWRSAEGGQGGREDASQEGGPGEFLAAFSACSCSNLVGDVLELVRASIARWCAET